MKNVINSNQERIQELETELSDLKLEFENLKFQWLKESEKHQFYQLIADFTYGWELWLEPKGQIKYCSPSCFDITGYSANQILNSLSIAELILYNPDQRKFEDFISRSLDQLLVNQSFEFRILTRTKQLRWCSINVRGVYNKQGKYLGVRAAIQDITRLKRAMGHIKEMEAGKEYEIRIKQRLQTEIDSKDRELVSFLLQLSQKNEIITKISNLLGSSNSNSLRLTQKQLNQLIDVVKSSPFEPVDWNSIDAQLEKIHPGFISRLSSRYPTITAKDRKLCAYIRLGLTSKEISGLLNITPKSVEIARVRLRKKLKLSSKIRLANFLIQL
ncbi:MAG: PAS domain S-box protein [Prolixibacteraceae bacterium]|nr:PAS domain S-box protein [Prolixibacteraceae bacterium]MBT6005824.1 PAS domain S-box protein [Prolixibacteraceae bacterium]MBT6763525.1 PAS domain S-box protein [Prolixibacteraceae bacterium]MBT6999022.1 PAS domain S-box protein [Prolixibacteraceae bacterium]MBT7394479.1 PAS domain S-box protein [Prolixibacteraceae bacterium]